jgi:hypothetical protein
MLKDPQDDATIESTRNVRSGSSTKLVAEGTIHDDLTGRQSR